MNKKKLRIIVDNWALQAELVKKKEIKQKQGRSPGDEDEKEVEKEENSVAII